MRALPQRSLLVFLSFFCLVILPVAAEPRVELIASFHKKESIGVNPFLDKLVAFFFGSGGKEDRFSNVSGVAVDAQDNIYLSDSDNGRVVILDRSGRPRSNRVGDIGTDVLKSPVGVAVDRQGRIYVTDSVKNQLFVFNPDGTLAFEAEEPALENRKLLRPSGVVVDEIGNRIIISDTGNHRLQIFDLYGKFISLVGRAGGGKTEFMFPTFLAKDSQGKFYVVDTINSRVQILDSRLNYVDTFGDYGDALGYFGRPKGIAVDSEGRIYVSDGIFSVISVFAQDKNPLMFFGRTEGLSSPMGLAVNSKNEIIAANSQKRRVDIFRVIW